MSKSGQAPAKTPARLEVGAGEWLNGHHASAEGQVPAGTMAEKVTGRSSHPSMNWLTWRYTFLPAGGALLETLLISPVRKRHGSALVLLLASIGAYLVGQNLISIGFGDDLKTLRSGNISAGVQMFGARLTLDQVGIVLGSALAILAVAVWLRVTHFGCNTRALANDEQLAAILGLPVNRVRMTVTVVGSGLAGLAGILFALDQDVVPTMGMRLLLDGIVAMIVGGRTSVAGAAAGGIIIGAAQNIGAIWLPLAWQDAVVFLIMVFFLLVRPYGIWGRPSRQATV